MGSPGRSPCFERIQVGLGWHEVRRAASSSSIGSASQMSLLAAAGIASSRTGSALTRSPPRESAEWDSEGPLVAAPTVVELSAMRMDPLGFAGMRSLRSGPACGRECFLGLLSLW